tara:strand:- start:8002 stop:10302 length:2301 start_codon:yes stop_codon:yes gene_type:complete
MIEKLKNICKYFSLEFPKSTILLMLLLTAFIIYGFKYLKQDDDMTKLLPDDMQSIITFQNITDEFGNYEFMYIAMGTENKNVFNQKLLSTAWDISKQFEGLDECEEVISISTMNKMYFDQYDSSIVIDDLMPQRILNDKQIEEIKAYLNKNPEQKSQIISKNKDYLNIVVRPRNNDDYAPLSRKIHEITKGYEDKLQFHYGGQAYVTGAVPGIVAKEVKILVLYGLLLMTFILLINLRSIKGVFLITLIILLSLASMLGFMGWVYHFTLLEAFFFTLNNTSMPIVLLTIANSDGVHFVSRFFRELREKINVKKAIKSTMDHLFYPITLTSITTASAFLCLWFSPIKGMNGYGATVAFGIMWAWALSLTLLPALISLIPWDPKSKFITKPGKLEKVVIYFGSLVMKYPKKILSFGLTIIFIAIIGLFFIKVEVNYVEMFKKGNILRDSAIFLDKHMTGNLNVLIQVSSDNKNGPLKNPKNLKDIEKLENFLDSMDVVTSTISIVDVVKQLHKTIMDDNPKYETIPENREKVNNLFWLYNMNDDADISSLINDDNNITVLTALMKTFSTSEMNHYKIKIQDFIDKEIHNDNIKFELSGVMAFLSDFIILVIKSSIISIIASIILIGLISTYFFRSWKFGILSIIPLCGAVIVDFGLMGLFGIDLTHMTAILSSIIIGVGVDFSIHYCSEYKNLLNKNASNKTKKTVENVGHPILLDALSNMGFASLMLSTIIPMVQIGGLMVFAMVACSFGTLTLLASAIELGKNNLK